MAGYSLSSRAARDIDEIYEYSILTFGLDQARRYVQGLDDQLGELATHPQRGRRVDELSLGLRRWRYRAHIIFYESSSTGIFVVRVLHTSMDIERQL